MTTICLILSAALVLVNTVTEPVITEAASERTNESMRSLIPGATGFEAIDLSGYDGLPTTIREIYNTENDAGYLFISAVNGYSGEITIVCAIDDDRIIDLSTLSHSETQGIGTVIEQESFLAMFRNTAQTLDGVDTVTGATISTGAYIGAVADIFTAYGIVR